MEKKIFGTLFFSIFSAVTGVGIVVPLLPVYAHGLGATGVYIGLIFGSFSLSRTVFLPVFGRRSDRNGRKPYIITGLAAYTLISFVFIFASTVESLIAVRCVQGVASAMIMPVTQAYVGDITPLNREGTMMGIFNMSTFIGLSIGPFLGGMLNDRFGLNAAFICMGTLSGIGFLLSTAFLPPVREEKLASRESVAVRWATLVKDRHIAGIFVFRLAYTACIGTIWGFLPVFADVMFSLSSSAIGFLVMIGVLTSGVLQTPMGYLSDRMDKRTMIVAGGLIITYAMMSFFRSDGFWDLFFSDMFFGVGGSISMAPLMAVAVKKGAEYRAMGAVMGLLTMAHSLGMLAGSLLGGLFIDLFDLRGIFLFGAIMIVTGTGVYFLTTLRRTP